MKDDLDKAKKEHAEKQREIDRLRQEYDDLQNNPPGNGGLVPVPPDDDDDDVGGFKKMSAIIVITGVAVLVTN